MCDVGTPMIFDRLVSGAICPACHEGRSIPYAFGWETRGIFIVARAAPRRPSVLSGFLLVTFSLKRAGLHGDVQARSETMTAGTRTSFAVNLKAVDFCAILGLLATTRQKTFTSKKVYAAASKTANQNFVKTEVLTWEDQLT